MLAKMQNKNFKSLLVGIQNATTILKTLWQSLTNLNIVLSNDPESVPLGIYPANYKIYIHTNLPTNAYSSLIQDHSKL